MFDFNVDSENNNTKKKSKETATQKRADRVLCGVVLFVGVDFYPKCSWRCQAREGPDGETLVSTAHGRGDGKMKVVEREIRHRECDNHA